MEQARPRAAGYLAGAALVAVTTAFALAVRGHLGLANVALIYLLPVLIASGRWGLMPGVFASATGALAFNFFLVPPRFTLRVADADNLITNAVLFTVAVVVSQLAAQLRDQVRLAKDAAVRKTLTAAFGEKLAGAASQPAVVDALNEVIGTSFSTDPAFLLAASDFDTLLGIETAAARWAADNAQATGRGTAIMASADRMYLPLAINGQIYAVVAVTPATARMTVHDQALLATLVDRVAQALSRIELATARDQLARRSAEDRLREALLSSVSHDLRTPLTTILGGLATLPVAAEGRDMRALLVGQATRLDRMIANLLEMTRLQAGAMTLRCAATDLTDAITAAVEEVEPRRAGGTIAVDIASGLPFVRTDERLLHHMLINLLDNALKYGGPHAVVMISAEQVTSGHVHLTVADNGPGIDAARADTLFARFARIAGDDRTGGSGLGLAIVRGFGNALGIATSAANRDDGGGASFTLEFPRALVIVEHEEAIDG